MRFIKTNQYLRKIILRGKIWKGRRGFRKAISKKNLKMIAPIDPQVESKHIELWQKLYPRINLAQIRFYTNFSGVPDHRYIPQEIFTAIVERILNNVNSADFFADKNLLDRFIGTENTPRTILRCMSGAFLNKEYQYLNFAEAKTVYDNIREDIIIKPSFGYGGGSLIEKWIYKKGHLHNAKNQIRSFDDLLNTIQKDFIIQSHILQHPFLASLNQSSVNTIRIISYRSPIDEVVHLLGSTLSTGSDGQFLIHSSYGGMVVNIDEKGILGNLIFTQKAGKFLRGEDHSKKFAGKPIPNFDELRKVVKIAALQFPKHRTIAFDTTIDENNKPVIIEVNLSSAGIANQALTGPLFREFTEEVVTFCANNRRLDNFQVFRT